MIVVILLQFQTVGVITLPSYKSWGNDTLPQI